MSCPHCPCPDLCDGRDIFCDWARSGDPVKLRHICERGMFLSSSPAQQAASLGRALYDWAISGFSMASDEELARRLSICGGCDQFQGGRCRLCGCWLAAKIRLRTEHCPLPIPKW